MIDVLSRSILFLWHYFHAITYRLFLYMEVLRLEYSGRNIPNNLYRLIWRNPSDAEDWVNLLAFVDVAESVLLVDIGANVGEFSLGFRKIFPGSIVIAFEPTSQAFLHLRSCTERDGNIQVYNVGISDKIRDVEMYVPADDRLSSIVSYTNTVNSIRNMETDNVEKVRFFPLDHFDDVFCVDGKTIIKIDVQGHEIEVLRGGTSILKKADVILCECTFAPVYDGVEPSFRMISQILGDIGFYPVVFQEYGYHVSNYAIERDVIFIKEKYFGNIFKKPNLDEP